jgi:hypothetical protein
MAGITGQITSTTLKRLQAQDDGVSARVSAIVAADPHLDSIGIRSIAAHNISIDVSEKTGHAPYPALLVYCDKLSNSLKEKFRRFSGTAHLVVEVRHSQEKLDALEAHTQVYVDAVCALLDDSRGDWGGGSFYPGGYDVSYEPVVRGGRNLLQKAKVSFNVEVSK